MTIKCSDFASTGEVTPTCQIFQHEEIIFHMIRLLQCKYITLQIRHALKIIHYKNSTVCLHPQTAKANRGGQSYTQSVVKLVIKYK